MRHADWTQELDIRWSTWWRQNGVVSIWTDFQRWDSVFADFMLTSPLEHRWKQYVFKLSISLSVCVSVWTCFLLCDCMQCNARYCYGNSVCLSVTKLSDALVIFWYCMKLQSCDHSATLLQTEVGGRHPTIPHICAQSYPPALPSPPLKNTDFSRFPLITSQP